jgi:hypothetical protein
MRIIFITLFFASLASANSKQEAVKFAKVTSGNWETLPNEASDCPSKFELTSEEGTKGFPTLVLDTGKMQARKFFSLNGPKERYNDDFGTYTDSRSTLEKSVAHFQIRQCEGLVIVRCAKWETAYSLTSKDGTLEMQGFGIYGDYSGFPNKSCRYKKATEYKED